MNTESTTPQAATTAHRYAVYFAPSPGTLGWLAAIGWVAVQPNCGPCRSWTSTAWPLPTCSA